MFDLAQLPRSEFLAAAEVNLQQCRSPKKLFRQFLAAVRLYLDADAAWLFRGFRRDGCIDERFFSGPRDLCDEVLVRQFAAQRSPKLAPNVLLGPLKQRGTLTGVIGAARRDRDFSRGTGRELNRLGTLLARQLARQHEERLNRVLERLKEKVVQELQPRDLAYQILGGLRELMRYDHSAALLDYDPDAGCLRVQAEKIVWTKAKSAFVGHELPVDEHVVASLQQQYAEPRVLCSNGTDSAGDGDQALRELLGYHRGYGLPAATVLIAAPLLFDGQLLGLLKIAGWKRTRFDRGDLEVVTRFLPVAAIALRNARVTVSLEDRVRDAELRAGLATLARAVAHDVNNAFGVVLPLAEQVREELVSGSPDMDSLVEDLDVIVDRARQCRRIFGNMLHIGVRRCGAGPVDLNQVVREVLPMLAAQVGDRPIELVTNLATRPVVVNCAKHELEHVVWNLATNSIDAIGRSSGRIEIATTLIEADESGEPSGVRLSVGDDGPGIEPEILAQVQEPFFSTKDDGTGLGLPICRSLVWQLGGRLRVKTELGQGTSVLVDLPAAEAAQADGGEDDRQPA